MPGYTDKRRLWISEPALPCRKQDKKIENSLLFCYNAEEKSTLPAKEQAYGMHH